MRVRWAAFSMLCLVASLALADDGIQLHATRQGAQDVRLDWTGGAPDYRIYRSASPVGLVALANQIGQTSASFWVDNPPLETLAYYQITAAGLPDGTACLTDSECSSAHCANGFCCVSGDCCASNIHCVAYDQPPSCNSPSTCQGSRRDGACASFSCSAQMVGDDSACGVGLESQNCGSYPSVFCTGAANQAPPSCATSCAGDSDCDANAHCDASACVPDVPSGGSCDEPSDCGTGLCVDSVCCTSSCTGTCNACTVSGSSGTCSPIPDGTDPSAECGAVSCSSFFWGWSGDSCFRKADVSATQASCGGDSACRTQSEECNAVTTPGSVAATCHSQCQDPNLATCLGTTAGTCTNVNPGNQTCGVGPCQVTVSQCSSGVPVTCVPGTSTTETCNDIDDNCDGVIDNGSFQDGLEFNNSCTQVSVLTGVGSDQSHSETSVTVYPSGDVDYFRFTATETDSICYCPFLDEDYRITTTLIVPPGSGSYEMCAGTTCDTWTSCTTVNAGNSGSIVLSFDGTCLSNDAYTIVLRVRGFNSPGFECRPYSVSYFFDAGLCL